MSTRTRTLLASIFALTLPACNACNPDDCATVEPADLAGASVDETAGGFCGELASGALVNCWVADPAAADRAPACFVDGWACQGVQRADGSILSRLDLHGPVTGTTIDATGIGYLTDGTTCVAAYAITLAPRGL